MYLISEEDKVLLDMVRINTVSQHHPSAMSISNVPSFNDSDSGDMAELRERYHKIISTGTSAVPQTPVVDESTLPQVTSPQVTKVDIPQKTQDLYCTGEKTKKKKKRKSSQTQTTPTESAKKERTCTEQLKQCKAELELCKIHGWHNLESGIHYSPMHKLPSMNLSSIWKTPPIASTPIPKKEQQQKEKGLNVQSGRAKRRRYEPDRFVPSGKKRVL